jgi:predicted ferric reductase
MTPMMKYGLGAWAILVWTFLSSLSPLRRVPYEVFVLQHIASAGALLLLWKHVPIYQIYNIWFDISVLAFDWAFRGGFTVYKNNGLNRAGKSINLGGILGFLAKFKVGHYTSLEAKGEDITIVSLKGDIPFAWKPGQHVFIYIPWLGPLKRHPFTTASPYPGTPSSRTCAYNKLQFAIRTQGGLLNTHTHIRTGP